MKNFRFDLYRYQILPIDREFQGQLFSKYKTIEELLQAKNEVIEEVIKEIQDYSTGKTEIKSKLLSIKDNFILYKFAANRSLTRETPEFREEELDNWPSLYVCIWNHPEHQIIAIHERREAFQHTETVIEAIVTAVNKKVEIINLRVHTEPLFSKEDFWKIIEDHKGKITNIKFELITPNMANISGALSDDLKAFAKNTNTSKTDIEISSDPAASLKIERSNDQLEGLVRYASEGLGNISLKVKGYKRVLQTSTTKRVTQIDEAEITGKTAEELIEIFKGLLP